jgi:hypothetical protein
MEIFLDRSVSYSNIGRVLLVPQRMALNEAQATFYILMHIIAQTPKEGSG